MKAALKLLPVYKDYGRKNRRSIQKCRYSDEVVNLIAKHLAKEPSLQDCTIECYGPFGLDAECSVSVRRNSINEEPDIVGFLTVTDRRDAQDNLVWVYKDYSKPSTGAYPKGFIGDLNGFNRPVCNLPRDMSEVMRLVLSV